VWVTTDSYTTGEGEATREPGGIYKSSDGGKTFVQSDKGITKVNTKNGGSLASNFNNIVVSSAIPTYCSLTTARGTHRSFTRVLMAVRTGFQSPRVKVLA
jgi:hypothetical protein